MSTGTAGAVVAVQRSEGHDFSKESLDAVTLLAGLGVEGDAHCGATVQHRSRVANDPMQPNLRQVHLIAAELHDELRSIGFAVGAGDLGENITTKDLDLLALPTGTTLRLGADAIVALTGLRNPCRQIDRFRTGLLGAVLDRDADGGLVRRAGVMGVVVRGGTVAVGDPILVGLPPGVAIPLAPV
jgi:MOSC domain-containing protein YiiM